MEVKLKLILHLLLLVYCLMVVDVECSRPTANTGHRKPQKTIPYQKRFGESCERPTDCNIYKILDCNLGTKKCVCMYSIHVWDDEKGCYYPFDGPPAEPTEEPPKLPEPTKPPKPTKRPKPTYPVYPPANGNDFSQITQSFIDGIMKQVNANVNQYGNWTTGFKGSDWWKQFIQLQPPKVPTAGETDQEKHNRLLWFLSKSFEVGVGIGIGAGFEIGGSSNRCPCIPGWNDKSAKRLKIKKTSIYI